MNKPIALTALALILMNAGGWYAAEATGVAPEVADELYINSSSLWGNTSSTGQAIRVQASTSETVNKDDLLNAALPPADSLEPARIEPLTFSALGIGCRQSYFADALEASTAEILLDVKLKQETAKLLGDRVNVSCDVAFGYEADGEPGSETVTQRTLVDLQDGVGRRSVQARINFLSLDKKVTRIELTNLACETVPPGSS